MTYTGIIETELASVRARIIALQTEEADLEAALRVFARIAGKQSQTKATTGNAAIVEPMDGKTTAGRESQVGGAEPRASAATSDVMDVTVDGDESGTAAQFENATAPDAQQDDGGPAESTASIPQTSGASVEADKSGAAPNEAAPAPTLKSRILALHDDHPELTATEAAERLGLTRARLKSNSDVNGIRWAPERDPTARPNTLRDKVLKMREHHPTWTARMIADRLGSTAVAVSTILDETAEAKPREPFVGEAALKDHYAEGRKRLGAPS